MRWGGVGRAGLVLASANHLSGLSGAALNHMLPDLELSGARQVMAGSVRAQRGRGGLWTGRCVFERGVPIGIVCVCSAHCSSSWVVEV